MSFKVYIKKGNKNYKENRLIEKLNSVIAKKPELQEQIIPAKNFDELKKLHDKFCIEDASFEEIESKPTEIDMSKKEKPEIDETSDFSSDVDSEQGSFIDPMNKAEPIVRDYVIDNELPNSNSKTNSSTRTSFDEPMTFEEAFELPSDDEDDKKQDSKTSDNSKGDKQQKQQKQQPKEQTPLNPAFDEMNTGKKKRSTKKFAKYIVETICMLSEKGFVWFANKDINEAKLAEYELKDEIDLDLLVSLEDGQQATVKQFFQLQCLRAEELSKIDPEEKQDLIDALAEVLLEKGVGPTPTQELMLIALKIFGSQAVSLIALKSQTNSLLKQLRAMKAGEIEEEEVIETPTQQPQTFQQPQQQQQEEPQEEELPEIDEDDMIDEDTIIENSPKTLE